MRWKISLNVMVGELLQDLFLVSRARIEGVPVLHMSAISCQRSAFSGALKTES